MKTRAKARRPGHPGFINDCDRCSGGMLHPFMYDDPIGHTSELGWKCDKCKRIFDSLPYSQRLAGAESELRAKGYGDTLDGK